MLFALRLRVDSLNRQAKIALKYGSAKMYYHTSLKRLTTENGQEKYLKQAH